MSCLAIEGIRHAPINPLWVDNTPIETAKKTVPIHVFDSMAKANPEEISFRSATSTRPKLESPQIDSRKGSMPREELQSEIALMRSIMDCYFQERDNREQSSLLALDKLKAHQKAKLEEEKAYLEESKKLINTWFFSWLRRALFGAQVVGVVLPWLVYGGDGPEALKQLMLSLQRTSAVSSGLVEIGEGCVKYYNNQRKGNMKEMELQRQELSDKMEAAQKEIQVSSEAVAEIMKQLSEIETKKYEASLNR